MHSFAFGMETCVGGKGKEADLMFDFRFITDITLSKTVILIIMETQGWSQVIV